MLLQYVCHSVHCQFYCQFGSPDSKVLYTDCVVAFSLPYSLQHLTCCFSMSFIQQTVSCSVNLVQLTVQWCIKSFMWLLLLLYILQHLTCWYILSVCCQLYCQVGSVNSTVLYTDCVLRLSVCIPICNI